MRSVRGQSAIEYLMTYGWAILVVLVAGLVVWQLGFLELSKNVTPDRRGFSQVTPLDWGMGVDGKFTVVIQNNAGTILDLKGPADGTAAMITVGGSGGGICPSGSVTGVPLDGMRPAATLKIEFASCPIASTLKLGDYYRVNLTISYRNPASGLPHLSNGVVWGPVG